MGDPAVTAAAELAAAQEKEKKMARVLQLKLDLEAARRKAVMVKLESQEKQAEVIQAAINEGLASSLAEVIVIEDDDNPARSSPSSSASPSSSSVGDLSQILGGQRVKCSSPSEEDKFESGFQSYLKFKVKIW